MSYRKERKKRLAIIFVVSTLVILIFTAVFVALLISDKEELRNEGIKEYKAGHYEEAIKLFKESLAENQLFSEKMDLDTRMYLGTAQLKLHQYNEAEKTFIRVHKDNNGTLDDNKIDTFLGIAQSRKGYGDYMPETIIPDLQQAVAGGNYSALIYLASCYYETGQDEEMIEAYKSAIDHLGMSTYIAYQLSSYYLKNNNPETAYYYVEQGLNADDDMFMDKLLYNQVVYYEKSLDYKKAYELMNDLYKQYPDDTEYRAEYDYLYTRVNINPNPVHVIEEEEEEEK